MNWKEDKVKYLLAFSILAFFAGSVLIVFQKLPFQRLQSEKVPDLPEEAKPRELGIEPLAEEAPPEVGPSKTPSSPASSIPHTFEASPPNVQSSDDSDGKNYMVRTRTFRGDTFAFRYPFSWKMIQADAGSRSTIILTPEVKTPKGSITLTFFAPQKERFGEIVSFLRTHASQEMKVLINGMEGLKFERTKNPFVPDSVFLTDAVLITGEEISESFGEPPTTYTYQRGYLFAYVPSAPFWSFYGVRIFDDVVSTFELIND